MIKKILALGIFGILTLFIANVVSAKPSENRPVFSLPEKAKEVVPNTYYLGKAKDVDGRLVEGYAFVRRKDKDAKPPWAGGGKDKDKGKEPACYGFLSKGARWKTVESWVMNPENSDGLSETSLFDNTADDIVKWEDAAGMDILGAGIQTSETVIADTESPDGKNEVYFADVDSPGAIAVTIVWGYFTGPPGRRELVEWDQIYDDVDYPWSLSGESGKMDFENIATHELGHSVGMSDMYEDACSEVTMYGYADFGEINKRLLEPQDITGVQELYK